MEAIEHRLIERSRRDSVDFTKLGFAAEFADHVFTMRWHQGEWREPLIQPYGPITLEPGTASLHYGQMVFEGLKAFRGTDGKVRVFRPDANAQRLRASCERMCIPPLEERLFCEAIDALLRVDHQWIPTGRGQALYIRPLILASEAHLDVRPSREFRLYIMTSPVGGYFADGPTRIALKVEDRHTRSAPGGTGFAKTAGNYAASLLPGEQARCEGFQQVLWLDAIERRLVEEVGQMNILFRLREEIVTPPLTGTILPGVTRDSVLTLLRERGLAVRERAIAIEELIDAIGSEELLEAFGVGTASVVAPIGRIAYQGHEYELGDGGAEPLAPALYAEILDIQRGERPDRHGWVRVVDCG